MRIRLLHITSSLKMGGAERVLYDLITHLDKQYEHHVIYLHGGYYESLLRDQGVKLYNVSGKIGSYDPIFFFKCMRMIQKINPDCMHSLLWAANVVGRIGAWWYAVPSIQVLHNQQEVNGRLRRIIDAMTLCFSDRLVAVSEPVRQSALAYHPQLHRYCISVIRNGIDIQDVAHRSIANRIDPTGLSIASDHFIIGCVGRFVAVKNYSLMISVFALLYQRYPQVRLVLVGMGPQEQELRNLASDYGVASVVHFVVGKSAYGYYPLFNCFVQPSLSEGISLALLEAMSLGLSCVAMSSDADHPVIKSGYNGMVVRNQDALYAALVDLIAGGKQWGQSARATIQRDFTITRMAHEYDVLIKKTLAGRDT